LGKYQAEGDPCPERVDGSKQFGVSAKRKNLDNRLNDVGNSYR
jgi:hypothetical protein